MCGIVGAAGSIWGHEKDVFKDLLYMDQLRGEDSTGIVSVSTKLDVTWYKRAVLAYDFLELKRVDSLLTKSSLVLIGHNRWATKGKVNSTNAHPFVHGDITGVHNGTLRNQSLLPEHNQFEVDSDNILYSINKIGVQATSKLLCGTYALVWWDSSSSTINFLRNEERDLWYAFSEDGKTIFWASEKFMLMAAMTRRKIKWSVICQVPVNKHLSWEMEDKIPRADLRITGKVEEVEPYRAVLVPKKKEVTNLTTVKKSQPPALASNDSVTTSTDLKIGINSRLDFYPLETDGTFCIGVHTDSDISVHIQCGDEEKAQELVDNMLDGKYYTLTYVSFITRPDENDPHGVAHGYVRYCEEHDIVDTFTLEGEEDEPTVKDHLNNDIDQKEFDKRYKDCAFCSDTLSFSDKGFEPLSYNEGLCGACAANPQVQHMCGLGALFQ